MTGRVVRGTSNRLRERFKVWAHGTDGSAAMERLIHRRIGRKIVTIPYRSMRIAVALLLLIAAGSMRTGGSRAADSCLDRNAGQAARCLVSGRMSSATAPYRSFTESSYWNTPLPPDAPVARDS